MLPADIGAWLERELDVDIQSQARIGSGHSREIWAIDARRAEGDVRSIVVRLDRGTGPVSGTALDLTREAAIYRALQASDIPIPRLLAVEPAGRALAMERVRGEEHLAAVDDLERRNAIALDYLQWLGRLHRLEVNALDLRPLEVPAAGPEHALDDLDLWCSIMSDRAAGWTAPATEFAVEWLRANAPANASATSICHGDAGPGNFLFVDAHVTALLDWEFAHVGDPHDDLAWVAVRTPLMGLGQLDLADAYAAWQATTGLTIEPQRVEYYRVFVLTRMIISCDAAVAWKNGVVDESILTHSILRPWLATAILKAIEFAGGGSPEVDHLASMAAKDLAASDQAAVASLIPALEPFAL